MPTFDQEIRTHAPHILLVEDSAINLSIIADMLNDMGCRVDTADNAEAALHALKDPNRYQLAIMDISLPDLDGRTVTKILRAEEKSANADHALPVIALTGHLLEDEKEACRAAGMNAFTIKPVDAQELSEIMYQLMFPHNVDPAKKNHKVF